MAKQLSKSVRDNLERCGWKPVNPEAPLYSYTKTDYLLDVVPTLNRNHIVSVIKMSVANATKVVLVDSDRLRQIIEQPSGLFY
jgi:hypothetical protein